MWKLLAACHLENNDGESCHEGNNDDFDGHIENNDIDNEDHDYGDDNIDDYDDQDQNLVRTPGDGDGDDDIVDQDQDQDHVEKFPAACHLGNNDSGDVDGEDDKDRKKAKSVDISTFSSCSSGKMLSQIWKSATLEKLTST